MALLSGVQIGRPATQSRHGEFVQVDAPRPECGDRVDPIAVAIAAGKGNLPPIRRPLRGAGNTVAALVVSKLQRRVASHQLHIDVVVSAFHAIPNEGDLTPIRRKRWGIRVSGRARENRRTQIRGHHIRLARG